MNVERLNAFEDVLTLSERLDVPVSSERDGVHTHTHTSTNILSSKGSVSGYNIVSSAPPCDRTTQRVRSRYENAQRSHTLNTNASRLQHVLNASRLPARDLAGAMYQHASDSEPSAEFFNVNDLDGLEMCQATMARFSHVPRKPSRSSRVPSYDRLQAGDFDFGGEEYPGQVSVSAPGGYRVQGHSDGYDLPGHGYGDVEHYGLQGYHGTCESTLGASGYGSFRERIMSGGSAASRCAMMLERLVRCSCGCVCVYIHICVYYTYIYT
jgi:hypothetical protein